MFQGCFLYNQKGPCYIQEDKTLVEKKYVIAELKRMNTSREDNDRAAQELKQQLKREVYFGRYSRRISRVPTKWKYTAKTRAYVREKGKGGIDQWRYQQVILIPLLIPFSVECMVDRPDTIIQEDNAPSHAS